MNTRNDIENKFKKIFEYIMRYKLERFFADLVFQKKWYLIFSISWERLQARKVVSLNIAAALWC